VTIAQQVNEIAAQAGLDPEQQAKVEAEAKRLAEEEMR
jgi:hypothetical protein